MGHGVLRFSEEFGELGVELIGGGDWSAGRETVGGFVHRGHRQHYTDTNTKGPRKVGDDCHDAFLYSPN